jgi:hypothetical protein
MAGSGVSVKGSDEECVLDPTRYASPGEVYSLLVGALSVILEAHWDTSVLEEIGVRVLADLDRALRDARASRGDSLARRLYDIPHLMERYRRKVLSAYYTDHIGVKVISTPARNYVLESGLNDVVVVDPFMGSGILLAGFIRSLGARRLKGLSALRRIPSHA